MKMLSGVPAEAGISRASFFVQRHRRGCLQTGTRGQEGIAQDAVNPGAEVGVRLERRKSLQRLDVRLLYQVFGFASVLGEPLREVVELVKERHGQFFERRCAPFRHLHRVNQRAEEFIPYRAREPENPLRTAAARAGFRSAGVPPAVARASCPRVHRYEPNSTFASRHKRWPGQPRAVVPRVFVQASPTVKTKRPSGGLTIDFSALKCEGGTPSRRPAGRRRYSCFSVAVCSTATGASGLKQSANASAME